ncbi:hypothetical protein RRG08_004000 [Elysia crispata]|uniref:Uncharacterized protein n=1 Tax=Elysia crispata TaxID=231223 RepID=A0AAE1CSY4_9GAST|nr:hypothetical protein RRG08_004000 [Elysia crispata]
MRGETTRSSGRCEELPPNHRAGVSMYLQSPDFHEVRQTDNGGQRYFVATFSEHSGVLASLSTRINTEFLDSTARILHSWK